MKTRTLGTLAVAIALLAMAGFATPAAGDTMEITFFPFRVIDEGDELPNTEESYTLKLFVGVEGADGISSAYFTFHNQSFDSEGNPINSSISTIFFEDTLGLLDGKKGTVFDASSGVSFKYDGSYNPNVLPGGDELDSEFVVSYGVDRNNAQANGINPGEYLTLAFPYLGESTYPYNDLLKALTTGEFRIGLHVISIGEESDGFVIVNEPFIPNIITVVPEPATMTLLGLGLAGIAFKARRRRA